MFFNYDTFHKAQTCHFITGNINYVYNRVIETGLVILYMHVQMIFIVKCISMYILFDQECEQALCGSKPAHAQTMALEGHCVAKWFSQILRKME